MNPKPKMTHDEEYEFYARAREPGAPWRGAPS